jgi:hypothetical protein
MIELIDLMHSDWHLYRDQRGLSAVCFVATGYRPTASDMRYGHRLVTDTKHERQVEAPRSSGEWVRAFPISEEPKTFPRTSRRRGPSTTPEEFQRELRNEKRVVR